MRRGTGLQGRAQQPAGGRAVLKRQGLNLEVEVPPAGVTGGLPKRLPPPLTKPAILPVPRQCQGTCAV